MNAIKRIYLIDLLPILKVKSIKTVKSWCHKHSIRVLSDNGKKIAITKEVEVALDTPIIKDLIMEYGVNWEIVYRIYKSEDNVDLINYKLNLTAKLQSKFSSRYVPKSERAKKNK